MQDSLTVNQLVFSSGMAVISSSALLGQVLASKARTASLALSATAAYLFVLVIYRLFLSPLAKIPGPKLAAATGWYEAYFQFIKRGGGQYTFKTDELHDIYGCSFTYLAIITVRS